MALSTANTETYKDKFIDGVDIQDGYWHHLVVTWGTTTGELTLFVDGEYNTQTSIGRGEDLPLLWVEDIQIASSYSLWCPLDIFIHWCHRTHSNELGNFDCLKLLQITGVYTGDSLYLKVQGTRQNILSFELSVVWDSQSLLSFTLYMCTDCLDHRDYNLHAHVLASLANTYGE